MPMSLTQALLGKIAEECAEVAQRALKAQQFGLDERQTADHPTNEERLWHEWLDLSSMVAMALRTRRPTYQQHWTDDDWFRFHGKQTQVTQWLEYSRALGMVEDAPRKETDR